MKAVITVILLVFFVSSSGYLVNESFAQIAENQPFLLEGSGFAVTKEIIEISEIDFAISSQDRRGSTINFLTEDGFVLLNNKEFLVSNLEGKFLREGRFIRINGDVQGATESDASISFFGRLVDKSKNASVYGFTGRIVTPDETFKVVYTAKLSALSKNTPIKSSSPVSAENTVHILKYSSTKGISDDAVPGQNTSAISLRFFSQDRILVEPNTTISIQNDDVVSHKIVSGKENYGDRHNQFTRDDRISTGTIKPGEFANITFDEAGFYRLYDPDYTWMKIIAYVFPKSDNQTFGDGQRLGN